VDVYGSFSDIWGSIRSRSYLVFDFRPCIHLFVPLIPFCTVFFLVTMNSEITFFLILNKKMSEPGSIFSGYPWTNSTYARLLCGCIGLFFGFVGLFCGYKRLFCRYVVLLCGRIRHPLDSKKLFVRCGYRGLFCGNSSD